MIRYDIRRPHRSYQWKKVRLMMHPDTHEAVKALAARWFVTYADLVDYLLAEGVRSVTKGRYPIPVPEFVGIYGGSVLNLGDVDGL